MFLWDGSEITHFLKQPFIKIRSALSDNFVYWTIENLENDVYDIVRVRTASTNHSCLIDEIKPLFNLHKIGTHWAHLDGKTFIFSKCLHTVKNGYSTIKEDTILHDIGYMDELRTEVQNIFIFRELLGICKNTEKNIIIREEKNIIKVIGCDEPDLKPFRKKKCISDAMLQKWFSDSHNCNTSYDDESEDSIDILTEKFLGVANLTMEEKTAKVLHLLNELQYTINRVCKNLITFADEITTRIRSRIL